jgi:hypothetical protein
MAFANLLFSKAVQIGHGCEMTGEYMALGNVVPLRVMEIAHQDPERIAMIYRSLGSAGAEQVIARALAELAFAMSALADRIKAHEFGDLVQRLKRLQHLAENLGLMTLAQGTIDLAHCFNHQDSTAFSAVWARLLRIAEQTLSFDGEKYDQSRP